MALTDEGGGNGLVMPVSPMYGGGNGGFGGGFGGDGWWVILLFLLLAGNGNWGGNGSYGGSNGLYPWLHNSNQINDGFRDQMLNTTVNGIQQGVNNLSTQLCNCCGDMQMAIANGFSSAEIAANARQIANMQQAFNAQTAVTGGLTSLSGQLAQCCCDNRLASEQLRYTIATENCADREALNYSTRDIIASQTAGIQRILDQMCNDKIDAKNEKIADLERQLTMANLSASQRVQTQALLADNAAQTAALEQYLAPVPRPAYIVQNPNCCTGNTCGGCGSF